MKLWEGGRREVKEKGVECKCQMQCKCRAAVGCGFSPDSLGWLVAWLCASAVAGAGASAAAVAAANHALVLPFATHDLWHCDRCRCGCVCVMCNWFLI